MEDGPNTSLSSENQPETIKNGVVVPIMANFPEGTVVNTKDEIVIEYKKVNGENNAHDESNDFDNLYSSESDALVIDEQAPKKKKIKTKVSRKLKESPARSKVGKKQVLALDTVLENKTSIDNPNEGVSDILKFSEKFSAEVDTNSCDHDNNIEEQTNDSQESENKTLDNTSIFSDSAQLDFHDKDIIPHSNPYFSESLFDLSQQHHHIAEKSPVNINNVYQQIVYQKSETKSSKPTKQFKAKPKAQLKEYAQYLGLQPTVQFKCSKCGKAGFESLNLLQEHLIKCNEVQNKHSRSSDNENSCSGFKLTRKVFLCSACGTYYENWNLYMHMLEFHRRYICLYCLGMFSILEDLYQHIQSRHNLEPGRKNTLDEFFNTYNEPCCLVCCECNKLFSEQDNFFYHNCSKTITKNKQKPPKQLIRPENHVTGESIDLEVSPIEMDKDKLCNQEITDSTPTENNQIDIVADITSDNKSETMTNTRDSQVNSSNNNNPDNDNSNIENLKQYLPNSENQEDLTDQTANDKNECDVNESIIEDSKNTNNCEEMAEDEELSEQPENALEENEEEIAVNNSNTTAEDSMEAEENKDTTAEDREESADEVVEEEVETRRVPKLSLKLPKLDLYSADAEDSDESDKAAMDVEHIESENEMESQELDEPINENKEEHSGIQVADTNIAITELELDQPLDKIDVRILLRKCLVATSPTCIYCNHSRKIAVNGKQLGLHAIAEHRYSAIVNSITAEELIPESFVSRIKDSLNDLESVFFNLESSASEEAVTFSHVFECFQCYYSTTVHKELYLHNRKFHSKNLLLCIMCKSNFYSYSELICHLCPGVYILDYELTFRCCMCVSDDLPSSFRLMVHLRKRHNVCDVCLEMCHNQYKLSNHVWKHKLHHFCYRCGIAYRNKPDITRHLFWKHGTQSVLCKKCLQKKWPHVYHFCVPPATFTCEECNLILTKAVSLKVHKRLHSDEKIHACTFEDCTERFISKKLMLKHEQRHREPPPEEEEEEEVEPEKTCEEEENIKEEPILDEKKSEETKQEDEDVKPKTKVDVYDLPELNLSESDSSDSESESTELKPKIEDSTILESVDPEKIEDIIQENADLSTKVEEESSSISVEKVTGSEMDTNPPRAIDENLLTVVEQEIGAENSSTMIQNIWDNFKTYQANKEKLDHLFTTDVDKTTESNNDTVSDEIVTKVALEETKAEEEEELTWEKALMDHDYCLLTEVKKDTTMIEVKPDLTMTERVDHDYCFHSDKDKDSEQDKSKDLKDNPIQGGVIAEKPSLEKVEDKSFNESIQKQPKKNSGSSSSSSSDSDSSSCSCGSNCSCSSSSGNSSSSSDSSESDSSSEEGRRKQQARRQKRRQKRLTKQDKKSVPIKHEAPKPPPEIIDVVATETKPENKKALPKAETPIRESDLETTESETDEEFYDRTPLKMAKKLMEEKRAQLLAEMGPNSVPNGSFIESTSRPPTPPAGTVEEEIEPKRHVTRKKKTKKRKKRKTEKKQAVREYTATLIDVPIPPYYQQFHSTPPTVAPITLSLSRNSPIPSATIAPSSPILQSNTEMVQEKHTDSMSSTDSYLRASKRRRIPNKFYGYSSDEENDKTTPAAKIRKLEVVPPTPRSPMIVPPITIKPLPPRPATPTVEPISIRLPKTHPGDFRVKQRKEFVPPIRVVPPRPPAQIEADSATESNESDTEEATAEAAPEPPPPVFRPNQPQLYCYCRCPYDEVSEMIGCDSEDCEIEWFHFECVGIMVPPKGQWFCPDCRKKKQQQRREILQA